MKIESHHMRFASRLTKQIREHVAEHLKKHDGHAMDSEYVDGLVNQYLAEFEEFLVATRRSPRELDHRVTMPTDLHRLLHVLWTVAVHQEGYLKEDWINFEKHVDNLAEGHMNAVASIRELERKIEELSARPEETPQPMRIELPPEFKDMMQALCNSVHVCPHGFIGVTCALCMGMLIGQHSPRT